MEKCYKVYMHKFPNRKVYIGMTCQEPKKRWNNGKNYIENNYMKNAINKYGWENVEHIILFDNLTKKEAEQKEIELIAKYKSNTAKYGYNIEFGGCHNGKTSERTRKKISIANKGKHNSPQTEFKKGHITIISEEAKRRLSKERKGKHISIKTEFKKGHKPLNARKVICIETQIIYNSIKEASIKNKVDDGHISDVCRKKRKTAGGYHWEYI